MLPTDSTSTDNYSTLYREKIQEAEWYKKPAARTTIKATGTITVVALIVIASISAYALSSPLSSIGTIGHNLVGSHGLIAFTSAGFAGSVILSVLLIVYIRKSIFRVSDYVNEDRGFLYAIKDENQTIKGYLYGTVHMMPQHWEGINSQIQEKLNECRKVIVECHEVPEDMGGTLLTSVLGQQPGVDFKIMDHVRAHNIELDQFETLKEQEGILQSFVFTSMQEAISDFSCSSCCSRSQTSMSMDESIDRILVTWQTGDEDSASNMLLSLTNGRGLDELSSNVIEASTNLIHTRNTNWMSTIQQELKHENNQPVLIAVGSMHLFDFDMINTTGLITQISDAGYTVERVER